MVGAEAQFRKHGLGDLRPHGDHHGFAFLQHLLVRGGHGDLGKALGEIGGDGGTAGGQPDGAAWRAAGGVQAGYDCRGNGPGSKESKFHCAMFTFVPPE